MEFESVIKTRTAVRKFDSNKTVSEEILNKILVAGNLAPTAKNKQPQIIYVVRSEEGLKKIDEVTPCRYGSTCVLLVCADKNVSFSKEGYSSYEMDASIVTTHMMLEATNLGVDNIWIKMIDEKKIKEVFNLDDSIEPVCILDLGYKTGDCPENIMHNIRKDISEVVRYL